MLMGMNTPGLYPPIAESKFCGATPTIVNRWPLMSTVWPRSEEHTSELQSLPTRRSSDLHADGDEHARLVSANCRIEVLRRYADDRKQMAVDEHRLAHHAWRGGEARLPVAVAEHNHWIRILCRIVLLREQAAKRRLQSEKLKVIAGHNLCVLVLGLVVPTNANASAVRRQHAREDLVVIAQILVYRIGEIINNTAAETARRS